MHADRADERADQRSDNERQEHGHRCPPPCLSIGAMARCFSGTMPTKPQRDLLIGRSSKHVLLSYSTESQAPGWCGGERVVRDVPDELSRRELESPTVDGVSAMRGATERGGGVPVNLGVTSHTHPSRSAPETLG